MRRTFLLSRSSPLHPATSPVIIYPVPHKRRRPLSSVNFPISYPDTFHSSVHSGTSYLVSSEAFICLSPIPPTFLALASASNFAAAATAAAASATAAAAAAAVAAAAASLSRFALASSSFFFNSACFFCC